MALELIGGLIFERIFVSFLRFLASSALTLMVDIVGKLSPSYFPAVDGLILWFTCLPVMLQAMK